MPRVAVESVDAFAHPFRDDLLLREPDESVVGRLRTAQRVRASRPPLIDEEDVALALDTPKRAAQLHVALGRGLTGTPGEEDERIGCGRAAYRRDDRHPKLDAAPVRLRPVLGYRERAAARGHPPGETGCLELTVGQQERVRFRPGRGCAARQSGREEETAGEPHRIQRAHSGSSASAIMSV